MLHIAYLFVSRGDRKTKVLIRSVYRTNSGCEYHNLSNYVQNVKKDLIITHMGNKPTCHVFPSNNKLSNGHYEVANDILYARSQKSTLLR